MTKSFSISVFKQAQNQNKIIDLKWLLLDTLHYMGQTLHRELFFQITMYNIFILF